MSRAHQPGALRRLAVAAMLAATVGVLHAPPATAVTEDGTTAARSDESGASDESTASDGSAASGDDTAMEARSRRDAERRDEAERRGASAADSHEDDGTAGTSGDPDDAQPLSTADENEGGANGDCPEGEYCSTRDGSASENGVGDGEATGKPCAGCVGKADNKNPQGQMPNADEDGNRGYECDDNQGVGQGNPAHTGCASEVGSNGAGGDEPGDVAAGDDAEVAGEDTLLDEPGAGAVGEAEVAGVEVLVARPGQGAGSAAMPAAAAPLAAILPATGSGVLVGLAAVAGLLMLGAGSVLLRRRAHG